MQNPIDRGRKGLRPSIRALHIELEGGNPLPPLGVLQEPQVIDHLLMSKPPSAPRLSSPLRRASTVQAVLDLSAVRNPAEITTGAIAEHMQITQGALKPAQQVPEHRANSNVHLLVVEGQITVTLAGRDLVAAKGALVPVAFKTLMSIRNASAENASFLILKTPNPCEMTQ